MAADPTYLLWHRVRSPFTLPERCHRCRMDDWEVFDVDKAGCSVCGRFHQCVDGGSCPGIVEVIFLRFGLRNIENPTNLFSASRTTTRPAR